VKLTTLAPSFKSQEDQTLELIQDASPVYAIHSMFSATDVANFLACQHTVTLDRAESRKEVKEPFFNDPFIELLEHVFWSTKSDTSRN